MNILYVSDDNYAMQTGISLLSLLDNMGKTDTVCIYIFELGISDANKLKLADIGKKYGAEVKFIAAERYIEKLKSSHLNTYRGDYSAAVRLGIAVLLPKTVERILYLDCDTLVVGDIRRIYDVDLQGKAIGMCYDCIRNERKKRLRLAYDEPYYNSGVLLIDVNKWIERGLEKVFLEQFEAIKQMCYLPDQDGMNILFRQDISPLPFFANILSQCLFYDYKGNCIVYKQEKSYWYTEEEFNNGMQNPVIYHFCGHSFIRPWYKNSKHPVKSLYDSYYAHSPWKDVPQQKFKWKLSRYLQYATRGGGMIYLNGLLQRFFILLKYHV